MPLTIIAVVHSVPATVTYGICAYHVSDTDTRKLTYRRLGYDLDIHQRTLGPKGHAQGKRGVGNPQRFRDSRYRKD